MTKDHLTALVDITRKLKLAPRYDIDSIKSCALLRKPSRKPSSSNLLEEVTEYAMRRRPSRDNFLNDVGTPIVMRRKVSTHCTLAHVRECEEDGTCKVSSNDVTDGMSIKEKLEFVKRTLNEIRQQDQILAREFLHTYAEIKRAKVRQSCIQHQDMLDDVFKDEHEARQTPNVCDAPVNKRSSMALRQCGVTRMNITSQRFSCS